MNKFLNTKKTVLVIASLLSTSGAIAQGGNDKDSLSYVNDSLYSRKDSIILGLQLSNVEVLAQRQPKNTTTSYKLGRLALDHHQMLNIRDVMSLLPGGKTINTNLAKGITSNKEDSRISLRSMSGEQGNASFGTAIEIDGMRLDNNAMMDETLSASTQNISSSNVESIEIITGIPSVEYGDVSNGVVKVNTRHGSSPFIFEASTNPHTWQLSLNKGVRLQRRNGSGTMSDLGTLNASFEHAQSSDNTMSPFTSYQRNVLSLSYAKTILHNASTYNIKAGLSGNIGGYDSKDDPDAFTNEYTKICDNQLRAHIDLAWIYERWKSHKLSVDLHGAFSTTDKRTENNRNRNTSSAQPILHSTNNGYYIAQEYDPSFGNYHYDGIILSPTGYWYERSYNDQKPQSWKIKAKGSLTSEFRENLTNNILFGIEYNASRNNGKGQYYESLQYAYGDNKSWRPYRYDLLPTMHNLAVFLEDKLTYGNLIVTAGIRDDITMIAGSNYGTVSSFSPRFNAKYNILNGGYNDNGKEKLSLSVHAGYGKSVKLPSFQILYPRTEYKDYEVFSSASTADNKAFYAYNTYVSDAIYNKDLKWQHTNQTDVGVEARWRGARMSLSFFHNQTFNPYQRISINTPITYTKSYSDASSPLASECRYTIDPTTGVVTATLINDGSSVTLPNKETKEFVSNDKYINGDPITRYGLEWILDLPQIKFGTSPKAGGAKLRLDGNYYNYKSSDFSMTQKTMADNDTRLLGHFTGPAATSNGSVSEQCNLNATITAHIPKVRLIVTLRIETTLLNTKCQQSVAMGNDVRGVLVTDEARQANTYHDCTPFNGQTTGYVAIFPKYYSTWENPTALEPFLARYKEAYEQGNTKLYDQLTRLIVFSTTSYYLKPERLSAFCSANISVTKEIGKWLSLSFYANNFLNTMQKVFNSQTGLEQSLFNSNYIPSFYYGISARIKI